MFAIRQTTAILTGVRVSLRAKKGARLYASGEAFSLPVADARRIAATRELDGALYASLSEAGRDAVFDLLEAGHLHFAGDEDA